MTLKTPASTNIDPSVALIGAGSSAIVAKTSLLIIPSPARCDVIRSTALQQTEGKLDPL